MSDADERPQDSANAKADAIALAEQAEAEAAEAEALAAAARARARALKLRREAEAQARADEEPQTATAPAEVADVSVETPEEPAIAERSGASEAGRRWRSILSKPLAAAAIVGICGLLGVSGWMVWHHQRAVSDRQRTGAFVAAAKQEIVNLTSLDFNKGKEGVQRILDSATGEFRDDFQRRADDFVSVVKDSKAVTEGKVVATAVESTGRDSAVVLVLSSERITNIAGAKDEPRTFRFRVSVTREGDQMKISKVEFVL